MKLENLKQIYSGVELKDYCEKQCVPGLEEIDCEFIIREANKASLALFIDTNRQDFMIAIKYTEGTCEPQRICEYMEAQKLYHMHRNLSDVIGHIADYKKDNIWVYSVSACEDVKEVVTYWNKYKEIMCDYNRLRSEQSSIETYGKNLSYTVSIIGGHTLPINKTNRVLACPDRATSYRRVSYLIGQLLELTKGAHTSAICYDGEVVIEYNLNKLSELKEFVLSLDTFNSIEVTAKNIRARTYDNLVIRISGPKPDVVTVSYNLIEYNNGDFPKMKNEIRQYNSYEEAKDDYDRLTRSYIYKYGPESGYKLNENEYYMERENEWTKSAYATDHLFEIKISNKYDRFYLKCSVLSH